MKKIEILIKKPYQSWELVGKQLEEHVTRSITAIKLVSVTNRQLERLRQ